MIPKYKQPARVKVNVYNLKTLIEIPLITLNVSSSSILLAAREIFFLSL